MLFNTSRDCENIRIKNNVCRIHANLLRQNLIRTLTDINFSVYRIRLARLIECHDNDSRTIVLN